MTPKEPTVEEMLAVMDKLDNLTTTLAACGHHLSPNWTEADHRSWLAIRDLIQKPRTVTPGQVDLWAVRIRDDSNLGLMHVRYLLYSMLADLGIEVSE